MTKEKAPERAVILRAIKDALCSMYGWGDQFQGTGVNTEYSSRAMKYAYRAEALIELLEVHDCGSTGGFDGGKDGLYSLEERLKLLQQKYGKVKK